MKRGVTITLCCGLVCFFMFFQNISLFGESIKIGTIHFQGNRKINEKTLRGMIATKEGEEIDYDLIRKDIEKIYSSGYFSDVKVNADFTTSGADITFLLEEKRVVSSVDIRGNDEVGKDELEEVVSIKRNDFYSDDKVNETIRKIVGVYNNHGYFDVQITTELKEQSGNRVGVSFNINEGEERKIVAIDFEGNNFFSGKELIKLMRTKKQGLFSWLTGSGSFKKDVFDNDMNLIEVKYLDNGFLDVKLESPRIVKEGDEVHLKIRIFEGIQYRVGSVKITGGIPDSMKNMGKELRTKPFQVFSREKMVRDILFITKKVQDKGYADASVNPRYVKQKKYPVVDIDFTVNMGNKYKFGMVDIKGNTKTLDKVIRRRLDVADGELYTATGLENSKANLMKLGYFKDVKVTTKKGEMEGELDVEVEVEEAPTGTLSGGFGFSSVDQFFGVIQVSENNLLGKGWRLSLNAQVGSRRVVFNLDFKEPNLFDTKWSFRLNAFNTDVEFTDFTRRSKGGKVGFGYPLSDNVNTSLSLRVDSVKIVDVDTNIVNSVLRDEAEEGAQNTHSLIWSISRDVTDSFIKPTRGSAQSFDIEYAGGILGGDSDFLKYNINHKYYKPFGEDIIYAFNGWWSHAVSTVGGRVPIFERYFLGGPNSIRGFESRTITPKDGNTGEEIGGNKALILNNEILISLYSEISLKWVFFFDVGNTWRQGDWPRNFGELRYGAGFGLRWFSPMGPLRLEWGFNLDPKEDERHRIIEFTIGNAF